jgi:hypothetical protein
VQDDSAHAGDSAATPDAVPAEPNSAAGPLAAADATKGDALAAAARPQDDIPASVLNVSKEDLSSEAEDAKEDLLLDFSFVPAWARESPGSAPASRSHDKPDDTGYRSHGGEQRKGRIREERRDRDAGHRPRSERAAPARPGPETERFASDRRETRSELPLTIEFLPERRGLAPLAHRLARSGRAFSLFEVAALFLSKPEYYSVKIAGITEDNGAQRESSALRLHQCQECGMVFLSQDAVVMHALERHFDKFYRKEEKTIEPPKGDFACIARCGLSGELLGPPNYHGFSERVQEVHRSRFAHLSLDEYRRRIENVHDPELVTRWKESMMRQTVYQYIGPGDPLTFPRFGDVERHFREHLASGLLREETSLALPGSVACKLEDGRLQQAIRQAWTQERRFPLNLSVILRLVFRRLGLHLFKTTEGTTYLTAICPDPIDPVQTIPQVREILEHLRAHPGVTPTELQAQLRPGADPRSAEVLDLLRQLRWLLDKGHVIEFADGKLLAPGTAISRVQYARRSVRQR